MVNSVSSMGNANAVYVPPKKSSPAKKGAYIGAGVGLGVAALNVASKRNVMGQAIKYAMSKGLTKGSAIAFLSVGLAIGAALTVGLTSLIGAGVGKIVEHFKKPKAQPMMAEENKVDTQA